MEYLKLAPDIDSDPDLEAAGWWAARVYELLLKVSALKDLRGRIPPEYQNFTWLARRWNFTKADLPPGSPEPEDLISVGVERLLKLRKLRVEDRDWVIHGWEAFYSTPKTGAERTKQWREKQTGRVTEVTETPEQPSPVTPVTPVTKPRHSDATPLHTTPLHSTESTAAPTPIVRPRQTDGEAATGDDFFRDVQQERLKAGLPQEKWPNPAKLGTWWSGLLAELNGDVPAVVAAYRTFARDVFWRDKTPPFPFPAFMSEWRKYVPVRNPQRATGN